MPLLLYCAFLDLLQGLWLANRSVKKYWRYYFICFPDFKGAWVPLEISHWIFQREGQNRVRMCLTIYLWHCAAARAEIENSDALAESFYKDLCEVSRFLRKIFRVFKYLEFPMTTLQRSLRIFADIVVAFSSYFKNLLRSLWKNVCFGIIWRSSRFFIDIEGLFTGAGLKL